jgi:hypothetical protein
VRKRVRVVAVLKTESNLINPLPTLLQAIVNDLGWVLIVTRRLGKPPGHAEPIIDLSK